MTMAAVVDNISLAQQLSSISADSFAGDADGRARVLAEAQKLVRRLEDPYDAIKRITFSEPTLICCILIADRMRLFASLGPVGTPSKSVTELAQPLKAENELVKRVLRHLAAHEVVTEDPNDIYGPTATSAVLADPNNCVGPREVANRYIPIFAQAPTWFEERGWTSPQDAKDSVFQKAFGKVGESFFEWLQLPENRHASDEFGTLMKFGVHGAKSWLDVRGIDDMIAAWDGQSALLVDQGGSLGPDARELLKRYPNAKGDLVVQDLPATVALANEQKQPGEPITFQAHDFFTEQPIKHAKMYFMGSILHDWTDLDSRRILRNLVLAMKPGYSTLFLNEFVLPEVGCHPGISAIDICMLVEHGAKERSVKDWEQLLASEGLRLIKVHSLPTGWRSVIEAEVA